MTEFLSFSHLEEAATFVRNHSRYEPKIGLVLGSGLGALVEQIENGDHIPYSEIPHWPVSTVVGHTGELVLGILEGHHVLAQRGRAHYYEGYSMGQITLPIRVMQLLGIHTLIITNAAGGLNPEMKAGDLMLITDHIGLVGMTGNNPLRGPNTDRLGPRFPDMSQAYDPELGAIARRVASSANIPLREGVYVSLSGPSFETPAELRFLRLIGSDAVGMSTVPEVIVARHAGLRVLGISGISNIAKMKADPDSKATHEEVLEAGQIITPRLLSLVRGVLKAIPRTEQQ